MKITTAVEFEKMSPARALKFTREIQYFVATLCEKEKLRMVGFACDVEVPEDYYGEEEECQPEST